MTATDTPIPDFARLGICVDLRAAAVKRLTNAVLIAVPACGSVWALFHFRKESPTWIEVSCFAVFYIATGIGIGLGYHRYATHQAFAPTWWLKWILLYCGSLAFQGSVIRWVADHRRHHRLSDRPWDTHSPFFREDRPITSRVAGLFHAHAGWMFDRTTTRYEIYAPDLLADPDMLFFHRFYWPISVSSLLMPWLYGWMLGGTTAAFGCLLAGGFLRITLLHNLIWGVNSLGHSFGGQEETDRDSSRNVLLFALMTFGEGWHNNHHAFPRSAYNTRRWYEIDPNGGMVWLLERLGVITRVVTPKPTDPTASEDAIPEAALTRETENASRSHMTFKGTYTS